MTTRLSLGSQRPPQPSLGGNVQLGQKPQFHREYSSSQSRRTESLVEPATEGESLNGIPKINRPRLTQSQSASVVASPNPAEDIVGYPRGKPRLQFDTLDVKLEGNSGRSSLSASQLQEEVSHAPLPMPTRPKRRSRPIIPKQRAQPTIITKKDARPKPYALEVPALAPHYPPNGHADFFPWMGNHPEDKLNDSVIRNGYFDKSSAQNETGTAKTSIYPVLKQKIGLQTLSSLFVHVLDQRRAHGQISTASTFKPPPRVTLTDTKRETWLRDLANQSISLRRLSRTIPHGIRGKVLLDQCLSKNIPTERAVWLAKCVGANEIRASKRKGVSGTFALGGEAKWIRDWTGFVENFVESIINSCGERDWKAKIGYAFRFAAHLHSEQLLDRDHYFDWLSSSLENCTITKLPVWLLNVQIYWDEILQYRRHGRRVASALLSHLHAAHKDPDVDILLPIIERIVGLVNDLVVKYPENFVAPTTWSLYAGTLDAYITPDDPLRKNIFEALHLRNLKLSAGSGQDSAITPRRRLIQLLDASNVTTFSKSLPREGWELSQDKDMLVRTLLEWATSLHRSGVTKVYIGARLLRKWEELGVDITATTLDFLDSEICEKRHCKESLYHLVSELIRSGHFSPARYIQWLIAGGRMHRDVDADNDGSCATRLLAEIPIHNLSESIETLRRTLLEKVGFDVEAEEETTELTMAAIDGLSQLQDLPERYSLSGSAHGTAECLTNLPNLSWTVRSEIGLWLRKRVSMHKVPMKPRSKEWGHIESPDSISAVNRTEYQALSHILESIGDFSMYADILKMITTSDDPDVLAAATDTLEMHLGNFACIGALPDLFDKLHIRMRMLCLDHTKPTRKLLLSLAELAARIPEREDIERQLTQEVIQNERNAAVDACSPVSDHMVEVLQNAEVDFADEIEKVLESGNTMDHATHDRLFHTIILRLETSGPKSLQEQRSCSDLLLKLRSFDGEHFELLMVSWLLKLFDLPENIRLLDSLGPLITNGCLSLKHVLDACTTYLESSAATKNVHASVRIAYESLILLLGAVEEPGIMNVMDIQRFKIHARNMQRDHPQKAMKVIKHAIGWIMASSGETDAAHATTTSGSIRHQFSSGQLDRKMTDLLRDLIVADSESVKTQLLLPLIERSDKQINDYLQLLLDHQLLPSSPTQTLDLDPKTRIEKTLQITDDLTSPFCQLQLVFQASTTNQEENHQIILATLGEAIEAAVATKGMAWAGILPSLDPSTAMHLCQQAESHFISLIPVTKSKSSAEANKPTPDIVQAKRFLDVIEAASSNISKSPGPPQFSSQIIDKLSEIWTSLVSNSTITAATLERDATTGAQSQESDAHEEVEEGLLLLLRLITIHACSSHSGSPGTLTSNLTPNPDQSRAGQAQDKFLTEIRARLLLHLISLLLFFQDKQNTNMVLTIFDIAILLVDDYISEESRLICVRALRDRTLDGKIRYLLGYGEAEMEWLFLCQKQGSSKGAEKVGEILKKYDLRPWEMLSEPTPNIGENDTSLSLVLFGAGR